MPEEEGNRKRSATRDDYSEWLARLEYLSQKDLERPSASFDGEASPRVVKTSFAREASPYYGGMDHFTKEFRDAERYNKETFSGSRFQSGLSPRGYGSAFRDLPVILAEPRELMPRGKNWAGVYFPGGHDWSDISSPPGTEAAAALTEQGKTIAEKYPLLGRGGKDFIISPGSSKKARATMMPISAPGLKEAIDANKDGKITTKEWEEFLKTGSWTAGDQEEPAEDSIKQTPKTTMQHEIGHVALRPYKTSGRRANFLGMSRRELSGSSLAEIPKMILPKSDKSLTNDPRKGYALVEDMYQQDPGELYTSIGALQRQTYASRFPGYKERLRKGEFTDLVRSGEDPKHLDYEGLKPIHYARDILRAIDHNYNPTEKDTESMKKSKKSKAGELKKKFLDRMEELIPAFVDTEGAKGPSQIRRI